MDFLAKNEAGWDRAIRVAVGLALLSLVFFGPKTLWGLVGLIPITTGLSGRCPMYTLIGINTCPTEPKKP